MEESVGLCARCAFAELLAGARGSRFWRCRRADSDPAWPRYPRIPVLRCSGFEEGGTLDPARVPRPAGGAGARGRRGER